MVLSAFQAVLMILVLIAVGYFVAHKGWAGEGARAFIPKLIINITLPCTVLASFLNNMTRETLAESWMYFVAGLVSMAIAYALGRLVAHIARIKKTQHGVFSGLFALSNSGYMGLPVAMAIFGERGMMLAIFYFAANTAFMNSVGFVGIKRDGMLLAGETQKPGILRLLGQVFTPPVIALVIGLVLTIAGVTREMLPAFLPMSLDLGAGITSGLALVFVGIELHHTGLSCIRRIDKPMGLALVGRFVVSPLVMFLVCKLFGFTEYATGVLVVQTGLPAMVATTIFAAGSGADTDLAARGVVITTLVSFAAIPLYIAILGM